MVHIGERHRRRDGSMDGRDTDTRGGEHMGIRDLRKARGMTQRDVGKLSGMAAQRISDYETGFVPPKNMTLETAVRIGDALGVRDLRKLLEPDVTPPGREKKSRDVD